MALSRVLFLVMLASIASLISAHPPTSDTTTSQLRNFRYVQINIVDTSNTTTNTFLPQLNGTIINLAENDMCTTPVFGAACNRTNNIDLLLRSTGAGTGTTKDISILSIFQCISIWGPARCGYDDGYTRVTFNQPQSKVAPDTYTVHVLTQHFGCPCSTYRPAPVTSLSITSIRLSPLRDNLTVIFNGPVALSTLQPYGTIVPLNTLFTSAGIARLGTNATARWINATTLQITLGTNPALSDTAGLGLLSDAFFVPNYPNIVLSGPSPPITTSDGTTIGFTLAVRPETNPDVFCSNIAFTITGMWPGNSSAIELMVQNSAKQNINVNYTLTSNGTNPNTTWILTIPTTTWSIGTYSIHLVVTSPLLGPLMYHRDIDIWRSGSCQCSQPRPYYQCHDCANPATPCLNNGTCTANPTLEKTTYSPANATSRSICTCRNAFSGYVCQIPPPCGVNTTAACGPHGLTCTNSADAAPVAICTCEQDWSGTKCTIMSEAWTYVTIRLLYNYSSITNQTQFSNAFSNEMGTALKRNPALFVVKSLRPGSTIVEFGIQPDRNNSVPSRAIYNQFMTLFNSNSTNFTGPILSTLDRSFLPIVLFDCNIDGCPQPESSSDRKWKLGVGLGVGLGGGLLCLFGICMYCLYGRHHHHDTSTPAVAQKQKEVAYPTSTTTTTTVTNDAPPTVIPQTSTQNGDIEMQKATDNTNTNDNQHHRASVASSVATDGGEGEKRSVVFHI